MFQQQLNLYLNMHCPIFPPLAVVTHESHEPYEEARDQRSTFGCVLHVVGHAHDVAIVGNDVELLTGSELSAKKNTDYGTTKS